MSVWPFQEFSAHSVTASRTDVVRPRPGARSQSSLWRTMLLLAGIVVIGFVTGLLAAAILLSSSAQAAEPADGSVLPFPPTPSASVAGPTL